jgi:hypothetical protein
MEEDDEEGSCVSWGGSSYTAGIREGDFQETLKDKIELLLDVVDAWGGAGGVRAMLETPDQWWAPTSTSSRKQAAKQSVEPDDERFLLFAQALKQAIADQKLCGLEVLENQRYDRKMPPCAYLGSDLSMCKVVIEGFLPSNADLRSGAPHLNQILAKIDPDIARNVPKLLRAPRDLVMDGDAACVADKVTATTILSTSVATEWWERHSIGNASLAPYMHNGVLTMSGGSQDVHLTITPYLSPDWASQYTYKIRAVMRTPGGDDASWKHNVALTFMLDLWHSAGYTKQEVEALILGQLRHQKVPAVDVRIHTSRLVETSRGKKMVPIFWWSSDTIIVIRSSDCTREKRYAAIWVGSIPSNKKDVAKTNPSFCLRIKLENPRQPISFGKGTSKSATEEEAQSTVPAVSIKLPAARPTLGDWLPETDAPERDILIGEVTTVLTRSLKQTIMKTGITVWDTCQSEAPWGGVWMPPTNAGFLKSSEAIVVASDEVACQVLVTLLTNSQRPRNRQGPVQLFPWYGKDEDDDWPVPKGWGDATFQVGKATFDSDALVLLNFVETNPAPLTALELTQYGVIDSLNPQDLPLGEREFRATSTVEWWNNAFVNDITCGLCGTYGNGSNISEDASICPNCWGELMAVMTLAYTKEDIGFVEGEGSVNQERPSKCQACQKTGLNWGRGEPEEQPFTCGACWLQDAQVRAARPSEIKAATGYTIEDLASQDITDRLWRVAMRELAAYRGKLFDECTLNLTANDGEERASALGTLEDNDAAQGDADSGEGSRPLARERSTGESGSRAAGAERGSGREGTDQGERTLSEMGATEDQEMVDGDKGPGEGSGASGKFDSSPTSAGRGRGRGGMYRQERAGLRPSFGRGFEKQSSTRGF